MFAKKSISHIFSVLFVIIFILSVPPLQAARAAGKCYVKWNASGTNAGTSWTNAYTDLQLALGTSPCTEVWVAAGTYKPTTLGTDRRSATFQLKSGVALYGGFAGTETLRNQRNPALNVTTLSGDSNGDDVGFTNNSENVYHVVTGSDTDSSAVLDGFTITAGNANGNYPNHVGGGMFNENSSSTLANLVFSGNSANYNGGGMYNITSSPSLTNVTFSGNSSDNDGGGMGNYYSSPSLTNVTFSSNSAAQNGGGLLNETSGPSLTNVTFSDNSAIMGGGMVNWNGFSGSASNPSLTNVTFSDNSAYIGGGMYDYNNGYGSSTLTNVTFSGNSAEAIGGGMYNSSSSPILTNVTFSGNSAIDYAGGMYNLTSSPSLTNVTFSANSAGNGGGMRNYNSSRPIIKDSIFWGNGTEFSYTGESAPLIDDSLIQGGCPAGAICNENILDADPLLGPLANNGGFTHSMALGAGSPAIDAGNDLTCAGTDQRGVTRPQGAHCDIGAYEYIDPTYPTVNTFTVTTPSNSLNIPITAFSATDDLAVTGYLITTSSTPPAVGLAGWTGTTPATYTVLADGSYTLFPWAKDADGHVSAVFFSPRVVVVETTAPTVQTITRADTNPTNAASVGFTVTFSEAVTGVAAGDFSLTKTGLISGESVTGISGGPTIYTVSVNTGTGSGTLRLDVPDSTTITDLAGKPLANLPYTGGETYTITKAYNIFLPLILH